MKYEVKSEAEMAKFGEKLATQLRGGEVLELIGDVGAGKTTLTRALARGLGITGSIQSPTFTISNRYLIPEGSHGELELAHYDFYRLHDAGVMKDELAESLGDAKTIVVIEWGDIIADVLPADRLTIAITPTSETERELAITAHGPKSQKIAEALA